MVLANISLFLVLIVYKEYSKKAHFYFFSAGDFFLKCDLSVGRVAQTREGAWHNIGNNATNPGRTEGEVCKLKQTKCTAFHLNYTIYDVISAALDRFEFVLPTLMHNFRLDKHIGNRVDCRCTWLARNATPRFCFKMTKIGDFPDFAEFCRSLGYEGRFRNLGCFLESPDDALS